MFLRKIYTSRTPKTSKNNRGLLSEIFDFDHYLTLKFGINFLIYAYFLVVKKGLKINFKEKVNFTDPYYFANFEEISKKKLTL